MSDLFSGITDSIKSTANADEGKRRVKEDDKCGGFVSSRSSQPAATNKSTPNPTKPKSFPPPSSTSDYVAPPLSPDVTGIPISLEELQLSKQHGLRRFDLIVPTAGREGTEIASDIFKGRTLAIYTSGGDSQGMNSAVRSITRMAIHFGFKVYLIYGGYDGMIEGGDYIKEASWNTVSNIIQQGVFGSARLSKFRSHEGRLKAASNLLKRGINHLICIGKDAPLTGANEFVKNWPDLVHELVETHRINPALAKKIPLIQIVEVSGSIAHDSCGTNMTIGTDFALQRIITCIISKTRLSQPDVPVIEVANQHFRFLIVFAALLPKVRFFFFPKRGAPENWRKVLCEKLVQWRSAGQHLNVIIVNKKAVDIHGRSLTATEVKNVVKTTLQYNSTPVSGPTPQSDSFCFSLSTPVVASPVVAPAASTPSADLFDFGPTPVAQSTLAAAASSNGAFNGFDFGAAFGASPSLGGATPLQPSTGNVQSAHPKPFDLGGPPTREVEKKGPSNFDLLGGFDDPTPVPAPTTQSNSFDLFSLSTPVIAAPVVAPAASNPSADLFDFGPAPVAQSTMAPAASTNGGFNGFDFGAAFIASPSLGGATPLQPATGHTQPAQPKQFDLGGGPTPKVGNRFASPVQFMNLSLNSNTLTQKPKTLNQIMGGGN